MENMNNSGYSSLLRDTTAEANNKPTREQKAKQVEELHTSSSKEPAVAKYGRMCAVVNIELKHKMDYIAWAKHTTIKEILEHAMAIEVAAYEKEHGEINH